MSPAGGAGRRREDAVEGLARGHRSEALRAGGRRPRRPPDAYGAALVTDEDAAAATSTWARRSAPTAAASSSSRSGTCSRSSCSWRTRSTGEVTQAARRRRPSTRTSRACSSSTPRAPGTRRAGASRSARWPRASRRSLVLDARQRPAARRSRFPNLDEIYDPTFSPDGQSRGLLRAGRRVHRPLRLRPGGEDAAPADARTPTPTCSRPGRPTARAIAFVTDRFSHRPRRRWTRATTGWPRSTWPAGRGRARCPPSTTPRTSTPSGRRTARSLYFLSDRTGITNVYRLERRATATLPR